MYLRDIRASLEQYSQARKTSHPRRRTLHQLTHVQSYHPAHTPNPKSGDSPSLLPSHPIPCRIPQAPKATTASSTNLAVSSGLLSIGLWLLATSLTVTSPPSSCANCVKYLCASIGNAWSSTVRRIQTGTSFHPEYLFCRQPTSSHLYFQNSFPGMKRKRGRGMQLTHTPHPQTKTSTNAA